MGKFFPKLSQTHVFIETDTAGNGFSCPMLPVSALGEMNEITTAVSAAKDITDLEAARQRMIALAGTVIPEPYRENLVRLDLPCLIEVITYLMYGDTEPEKKAPGGAGNAPDAP